MKHRTLLLVLGVLFLTITVVGLGCSGQQPANTPPAGQTPDTPLSGKVDGYVVIAPQELRPGAAGSISVSLFDEDLPAQGIVRVSLNSGGRQDAAASGLITGAGSISLPVPDLPPGNYRLAVEGPGFSDEASLRVRSGASLFLETDKPIYKPGQRVMMRVLTVGPELRPVTGDVTVEVQDAKGSKVFKQTVTPGEYGMATLDMPLSSEPNLGVWKITARSGKSNAELDVRVEKYVLPKYEVTVDLPREWVLAGEKITGRIDAEVHIRQAGQGRGGDHRLPLRRRVGGVRHPDPADRRQRVLRVAARPIRGGSPCRTGHGQREPGRYGPGEEHRLRRNHHPAAHRGPVSGQPAPGVREQRLQAVPPLLLSGRHRNAGQQAGGQTGNRIPAIRGRRPGTDRGARTAGEHPKRHRHPHGGAARGCRGAAGGGQRQQRPLLPGRCGPAIPHRAASSTWSRKAPQT